MWFLFPRPRLIPRRRVYRSSCSRNSAPATPATPAEIIWWVVALAALFAILAALNHNTHTTSAPPPGWYTGYDGNYYPNSYPVDRTLPPPPAKNAASASPSTPGTPDWITIGSMALIFIGGIGFLFAAGIMMKPKPLPGATAPAAPSPPRRRRPPPPPPKWRPYDQPFDL